MANTKSATKRARQSIARSLHNRSVRTRLRTLQKRARAATKPAPEDIRTLISAIDRAAKRGIIHRNAANRRKARLNKMIAAARK
jgi:small subunit ribosomal protein S20